ncbi:hypothetical protein FDC50_16210 [Clostridium botulinum]|nr:hypothetical protein KU41_12735 [Clostridium botulinum]MBY6802546.1 hypothetical protein [Clostridium botulinum]MBY6819209.1 hypothetical protein [Clostridium botulinum]NFJ50624.1 hypothetical protein [Clostridium botulinum]NFP09131.1 hypothetical protein [Clostridium botulinum]
MELNNKIYEKILVLCENGDTFVEAEKFSEAINKYVEALNLIPNPKSDWEASTWIYTALGDTCFLIDMYEDALNFMFEALKCPDALGNPFILLRIGECFYELNNYNKAKEYLLQAYICDGINIFDDESEKYFDLIKQII